jgi:flagellar biosynthesis GTPase FlhF
MSKTRVHLPEDFSWYNKETKETIIKSIKEEYGDKVTILSYIPKSVRALKPKPR